MLIMDMKIIVSWCIDYTYYVDDDEYDDEYEDDDSYDDEALRNFMKPRRKVRHHSPYMQISCFKIILLIYPFILPKAYGIVIILPCFSKSG